MADEDIQVPQAPAEAQKADQVEAAEPEQIPGVQVEGELEVKYLCRSSHSNFNICLWCHTCYFL